MFKLIKLCLASPAIGSLFGGLEGDLKNDAIQRQFQSDAKERHLLERLVEGVW